MFIQLNIIKQNKESYQSNFLIINSCKKLKFIIINKNKKQHHKSLFKILHHFFGGRS